MVVPLAVVSGFFALLLLAGGLAELHRRRSIAQVFHELRGDRYGFRKYRFLADDGLQISIAHRESEAWTWSFEIRENEDGKLFGPGVHLSALLGIPLIRLQCALPELHQVQAEDENPQEKEHKRQARLKRALLWNEQGKKLLWKLPGFFRKSDDQDWEVEENLAEADTIARLNRGSRFYGTALALAFLDVHHIKPPSWVEARISDAHSFFCGEDATRNEKDQECGRGVKLNFRLFVEQCKVMLYGNISRTGWRRRAQLWRFIFLQAEAGYWELSDDIAEALRVPTQALDDSDDDFDSDNDSSDLDLVVRDESRKRADDDDDDMDRHDVRGVSRVAEEEELVMRDLDVNDSGDDEPMQEPVQAKPDATTQPPESKYDFYADDFLGNDIDEIFRIGHIRDGAKLVDHVSEPLSASCRTLAKIFCAVSLSASLHGFSATSNLPNDSPLEKEASKSWKDKLSSAFRRSESDKDGSGDGYDKNGVEMMTAQGQEQHPLSAARIFLYLVKSYDWKMLRRFWATSLAVAFQEMNEEEFWNVQTVPIEVTSAQHARNWLKEHLPEEIIDCLVDLATKCISDWNETLEEELLELKRLHRSREIRQLDPTVKLLQYAKKIKGQALGVRAVLQSAVGDVISLPGVVMCIMCGTVTTFMVDTWMYYSASMNCCDETKQFLCLDGDPLTPCYFAPPDSYNAPQCGVIMDTYGDMYTCEAFPTSSYRDRFLMGLITSFISFPMDTLVYNMFKAVYGNRVPRSRYAREKNWREIIVEKTFYFMTAFKERKNRQLRKLYGIQDPVVVGKVSDPQHIYENRDNMGLSASWLEKVAYLCVLAYFCTMSFLIFVYSTLLYQNVRHGAENDVFYAYFTGMLVTHITIQTNTMLETFIESMMEKVTDLREEVFDWEEIFVESIQLENFDDEIRSDMERLISQEDIE